MGLDRRTDLFALQFDPPSQVRDATARERDRRRHDSVDRVSARRRPYLHRRRHGHRVRGPGGVGRALQRQADSARFARLPSTPVRGHRRASCACCAVRGSASSRSSFRCPRRFDPMLERCDAALVIGDPALYLDHQAAGLEKIDLGERVDGADRAAVRLGVLGRARQACCRRDRADGARRRRVMRAWRPSDAIADAYCGPDRAALGRAYLRDNISTCSTSARRGLRRYYELAEGTA